MEDTKELTKALLTKGLGEALKNQSFDTDRITYAKWILYFSIGPILLILLSNYLLIQIIVAIIYVLICAVFILAFAFSMFYQGMMQGAKRTLENPPPIGETYIEFTESGKRVWKSGTINFQPKHDSKKNSMTFNIRAAYPDPKKRQEIVTHYRSEAKAGNITDKEGWAQSNYGISRRTLLNYEGEFPDTD